MTQGKSLFGAVPSLALTFGAVCVLCLAAGQTTSVLKPAGVDGDRILHADGEPGNWMTHGRTYSEQRFSPLKQINDQNVHQLGLAWYYDLDTNR